MCAIDGFPTIDTSHTAHLLSTATLLRHIFILHLTPKLCFLYGKMRALDGFPTIDTSPTRAAHLPHSATLRRRIFIAHVTRTR
ncbi:hypothetical protein SFRURICE_018679 [Spodoptera frugiperda]|nr:hypothetical protein SFRURICE_018679 [Spodoptera frugiperda]